MKMVIFPAVGGPRLSAIQSAAESMEVMHAATEADAIAAIADADAFFGKLTPQMLSAARRLRWVQSPTASLEHYVFPALVEHPCVLTNMRGLFSDVVADHTMGLVIMLARNLHHYVRQQMSATWESIGGESRRTGFEVGGGEATAIDHAHLHLADATLGIIGLGAIGREIARRASAFGLRVVAVDPSPAEMPDCIAELWPPAELPRLLAASDFVVIAAPHTPATDKLIRHEQMHAMKPTAFLVNVGRGAIVDVQDLTSALRSGHIAGAALDVCEHEPLPADHPLWTMPNVIITPHVAAASPRIAERHLALLVDNIRLFVGGSPLRNVVDKASWY